MAGTISFTGMSTSQNINEVIDALVANRRAARVQPLENRKYQYEVKLAAISTIDSAVSSFYAAVRSMDRYDELMVSTADASDTGVVQVTASGSTAEGSHMVEVAGAVQHRLGSRGLADADTTAHAADGDQLDIAVGGSSTTVTFSDNGGATPLTLDEIAAQINSATALVSAEVIDDGTDGNPHRLVLTASSAGAANAVSINANDTAVDFAMADAGDRIDEVETVASNGTSAAASGGQYLGTTNKTFTFTVTSEGTEQTVGTDSITLHWTDGEGNSGDITLDDAYSPGTLTEVFQGVQVQLGAGTVAAGDSFKIDAWHPDLQAAQDDGLARAARFVHSGFADSDTTAVNASGTDRSFTYTYNGQATTVTVASGTTLAELAALINNDNANPGVTASVINDGSGLSNAYHLVLAGQDTGAAYQINEISHDLDNFAGSFTRTQAAQNAMLRIDNYPPEGRYLQQTSNRITALLPGLTLDLVDTGSAHINVRTDTGAIIEKVEAFREAFNAVRQTISTHTGYDLESEQAGSLLGNFAIRTIKSNLDGLVAGAAPGFAQPQDAYINLQQLGFYTDVQEGSATQGQLLLDTAQLRTALSEDPEAVAKLFTAHLEGSTDDDQVTFGSALDTTAGGIYDVEIDMDALTGRFRLQGSGEWSDPVALSGEEGSYSLTAQEGSAAGLALNVHLASGTGVHQVEARVANGVMARMGAELEDILATGGTFDNAEDNYNAIVENLEERIASEESRLESYEDRLVQSFARLDAYMTRMDGIGQLLYQYMQSGA